MKRNMRVECGKYLAELGSKNNRIVALEADLKESTQSVQFQQAHPRRYLDMGIAEQNMVGVAAGLALGGMIPVVHSFACFISMRSCEQVRTSVAYPNLNVKFIVTHGGISTGTAGTTHHATEDLAIMRSVANMTVLVPGDVTEMKQVLDAALKHSGPVYVRLGAGDAEDVYGQQERFEIGKAVQLKPGNDATIITTGTLMFEGLMAANKLKKDHGLDVRVLQMASIKPLDKEAVTNAAIETGSIVTVEEHNILGGLGGAVCEVVAELGQGKVKRLGVNDCYCGVGSSVCLMHKEKLTESEIISHVLMLVNERKTL